MFRIDVAPSRSAHVECFILVYHFFNTERVRDGVKLSPSLSVKKGVKNYNVLIKCVHKSSIFSALKDKE